MTYQSHQSEDTPDGTPVIPNQNRAQQKPGPWVALTDEDRQPEPMGHIHSNGDFCAERQVESRDWPVNLYTADQMREAILKEREQADEDAKRYRWLREHAYIELECDSPRLSGFTNDGFDAAVDAAAFRKG